MNKETLKLRPELTKAETQSLSEFEKKIGYVFANKDLLRTALTHTSYTNELKAKGIAAQSNERLEFFGDSILSVITAEYLYGEFRQQDEGDLTRLRALAVCEDALYEYSRQIELGVHLYLGHGEEISNGRDRKSILADAFEAVIAAIQTDSNMGAAKVFVLGYIVKKLEQQTKGRSTADFKTLLQTIVQQTPGELLEYALIGYEGPEHDRIFIVDALLNDNPIGRGEGRSKRQAEQMAAKQALELFGIQDS